MAEKGINLGSLARREEALIKIKKDLESNLK